MQFIAALFLIVLLAVFATAAIVNSFYERTERKEQ